jgi:hypothetical protein
MKNLLSMARGFAVHLHLRVMSYVASGSEKRAFSELPLFVRPLTISPKTITKSITYKRPALSEAARGGGLAYASTRDINNCRGELTASASDVRE